MVLKNSLFAEFIRFGVIGMTAAAVHFSIVVLLVESHTLPPLMANVFAFFIAFQVSYFGHRQWTFGAETNHSIAMPKLLLISFSVFMANEGSYYVLMSAFHLPYALALFIVLAVLPVFTFTLSKFWVFR